MIGAGEREETLSIVVPAYNEARRLPRLLALLDREADRLFGPAGLNLTAVIVVDDGSTDETPQELERYDGLSGKLRVIGFEHNRGKGAAVRAGMLAATGQRVLMTDADMSAPLEQTAALSAELDHGFDLVLGSRGMRTSQIHVHQNLVRKRLGKLYNRCFRLLTGLSFQDTQCGFKLFRLDAAQRLFALQTVDGFAFDVEVCVNAKRLGLRVAEVPIEWSHSRQTQLKLVRSSARMALDLCRIAWRARTAQSAELAHHPASPRVDESA